MRLETEDGPVIENPSADQLREALAALGGATGTFAFLTRQESPLAFLQTSSEKNAFVVECREGDKQFRAADEAMPLEKTTALFQAYLRGGDEWRGMAAWQDMTSELSGPRWVVPLLIFVAALLIIALVLLYKTIKL